MLFYAGPTGDPSVTPDAYWWIGDRPIGKIDTLYLGTISRLPGIMLGSAFAMVWRPLAIVRGPLRSKGRIFDVLAVLALVFLGWMCANTYLATPAGADPFLFRGGLFLTSIATLVVIAAITHRGSSANRRLGSGLLVWIGLRSYGLYLYHWPIYQMIRGIAGNKLTLREFVLATILTVVVAEASYRLHRDADPNGPVPHVAAAGAVPFGSWPQADPQWCDRRAHGVRARPRASCCSVRRSNRTRSPRRSTPAATSPRTCSTSTRSPWRPPRRPPPRRPRRPRRRWRRRRSWTGSLPLDSTLDGSMPLRRPSADHLGAPDRAADHSGAAHRGPGDATRRGLLAGGPDHR